jgi:Predicted Zn-dependent peptidases, insulinase-like
MELKKNELVHGFRLVKKQNLPDCEGTLYLFEHEKTGAINGMDETERYQ